MSRDMISIAEDIVGFPVDDIDYVMAEILRDDNTIKGSGKTHIIAVNYKLNRFRTLCGVEDVCGHWPFSGLKNIDDKDFCKRCAKSVKKGIV